MALTLISAANPQWANAAHSMIFLQVQFKELPGTLQFSASPNDTESHGVDIYNRAVAGEFGAIVEFPLAAAKSSKKGQINAWRAIAIDAGMTFAGHNYDSDDVSRANLTGAVAAFVAGVPIPAGFTWRTSDNQDVAMDLPTLIGLAGTMIDYVNTQYAHSWQLKAQADAATTVSAVEAITW